MMSDPKSVSDSQTLRDAIEYCNTHDDETVIVNLTTPTIKLSEDIPPISTAGTITIGPPDGQQPVRLDCGGQYRGFLVISGNVNISNVVICNAVSTGAPGCLGAGGGLLVANVDGASAAGTGGKGKNPYRDKVAVPAVVLRNVSFQGCAAQGGGNGALPAGGRGGYSLRGALGVVADNIPGQQGFSVTLGGNSVLGLPLAPPAAGQLGAAGYFGAVGASGAGGNGGENKSGWNQYKTGGGTGNTGGAGGFGAAGGAGGGGGGGSAGDLNMLDNQTGADGGPGGYPGSPGFGGGAGQQDNAGRGGQPGHQVAILYNGSVQKSAGGDGGWGLGSGSGAGFGGAVFAMSNVTLTLGGTGSISGSQARAFQPAASAGDGIFLQGAGTLTFAPDASGTYTVLDQITDEKGAVRDHHVAAEAGRRGADGLWATGGDGVWSVRVNGKGTLALAGPHDFTGSITVDQGSVDLSAYISTAANNVFLAKGTTLIVAPAQPHSSQLTLGVLHLADDATISLNDGAKLSVGGINQPRGTLTINVKVDKTPPPHTPVAVIKSDSSLAGVTCKATAGYQADIDKDGKSIVVTAGGTNA